VIPIAAKSAIANHLTYLAGSDVTSIGDGVELGHDSLATTPS